MVTITGTLLDKLKLKNPRLYDWFTSRGIDLQNLNKYTSGLAMAIALATAQPVPTIALKPRTQQTQSTPLIQANELKGKSDLERANLVWARYGHLIRQAADDYDLDPNLIFATIMVESGGNTYAIRQEPRIHDASYGLGQLLYGTARGLGYRGRPEGLHRRELPYEGVPPDHPLNAEGEDYGDDGREPLGNGGHGEAHGHEEHLKHRLTP